MAAGALIAGLTLKKLLGLLAAGAAIGTAGGVGTGLFQQAHNREKQSLINQYAKDGYTRDDISYVLDQYDNGAVNLFDPASWINHGFDMDRFNKDLLEYQNIKKKLRDMPLRPDDQAIIDQASSKIDQENAEINELYDKMLGRSTDLMGSQMQSMNQSYNDYRNQILTNNAQQQNMLMGGMRSELDRQQRTAITRGASAAQRLVANINAQMSTQNKAAQLSLDTSNNLAQSLLSQRNAANQLRSDYTNMLNNDTNRRADLMRGTAERKTNYGNSMLEQEYNKYNNQMDTWNDRLSSELGTNPWAQVHRNQATRNQYSTNNY